MLPVNQPPTIAGPPSRSDEGRDALRSRLLAQRRGLSSADVKPGSAAIVELLQATSDIVAAARQGPVAVYWPVRGEPDVRLGGPNDDAVKATRGALTAAHGLTLPGHPGASPELRAWKPTTSLATAWGSLRFPADGAARAGRGPWADPGAGGGVRPGGQSTGQWCRMVRPAPQRTWPETDRRRPATRRHCARLSVGRTPDGTTLGRAHAPRRYAGGRRPTQMNVATFGPPTAGAADVRVSLRRSGSRPASRPGPMHADGGFVAAPVRSSHPRFQTSRRSGGQIPGSPRARHSPCTPPWPLWWRPPLREEQVGVNAEAVRLQLPAGFLWLVDRAVIHWCRASSHVSPPGWAG